jgi:hypothetical protein
VPDLWEATMTTYRPSVLHRETYDRHTIQIVLDEDPLNPRDERYYDQVGRILFDRAYVGLLGDGSVRADAIERIRQDPEQAYLLLYVRGAYNDMATRIECLPEPAEDWHDHIHGIICAPKQALIEEFGSETAGLGCLRGEVECYASFVRGERYGFEIVGELEESVYGYDSIEDATAEAKSYIDNYRPKQLWLPLPLDLAS